MAHRRKHRAAAAARRDELAASGVAVDTSHRSGATRRGYYCPACGNPYRTVAATRVHFRLHHVTDSR